MQTKKLSLLLAAVFSAVVLASCSSPQENPEEVIQKFKTAATEIQSGDLDLALVMKGADAQDQLDFNGQFEVKFDRPEDLERKAELGINLTGSMQAAGRSLAGDLAVRFKTLGEAFYINLEKLETTDPGLASLQPLLKAYSGRWLKLAADLIPENVRKLQVKDEATLAKEAELKALFINTHLFDVSKEYGVESVEGHKTYHYGIRLKQEGLQDYFKAAAALEGKELSEQELSEATRLLGSISEAELWIGTEDYYPYKGFLKFTGEPSPGKETTLTMELTLSADSYNKPLSIEAPKDAEEFDPLALFMGATAAGLDEVVPAPAE